MKSAGCVCSKNRSIGRATPGRSTGSVSSRLYKKLGVTYYNHATIYIYVFIQEGMHFVHQTFRDESTVLLQYVGRT